MCSNCAHRTATLCTGYCQAGCPAEAAAEVAAATAVVLQPAAELHGLAGTCPNPALTNLYAHCAHCCLALHLLVSCVQVNADGVFRYAYIPWFAQALQVLALSGVHGVAVDVWVSGQHCCCAAWLCGRLSGGK